MPGLGGILGGARRLGTAFGQILIDTSGAEQAQMTMRRVGQNIGNAFSGIERKARTFSAEVSKVNRELTALGIVGGIISAMGIRAAASFEEVTIQLRGMTGSMEKATELTEQLRKSAADAGLPFADLLQAAKQLLPTLEGNTEQLQGWLDLTQRVSVLNQREGITGAAFAINEALTSGGTDLVSLTERFNISRVALRAALKETGDDFGAALDIVLTKMGITQSTADQMGRTFNASFRAAKDAALQLLAQGFEPMLKILTPILSQTATWLTQLRESAPMVATLGAALASIVTVGAPGLLMLNQIAQALQRINKLAVVTKLGGLKGIAGGLGKGAVLGTSAIIGANVGAAIGRGVGRARGDEAMANATVQDALRTGAKAIVIVATVVATQLAELAKIIARGAAAIAPGFANILEAMGLFIQRLLDLIPGKEQFGPLAGIRQVGEDLLSGAEEMRGFADNIDGITAGIDKAKGDLLTGLAKFLGVLPQAAEDLAAAARAAGTSVSPYTPEQTDAIFDFYGQVGDIERDANRQRLEATRQYEQQRTSAISGYEQTLAREAEDFARQRTRQQQELDKSIADIQRNTARREQQWREDLNKRIAEIEEEGQRQLEQMRRDHNLKLMEAAANLDARAVAEEQRRFREQVAQQQQGQDERIDKEREANQERIDEARRADDERIQDLRDALAERQALEDDDRALRLTRMQEDHEAQLEAMAAAQKERIDQINAGAIEERNAAWDGLLDRLDDLGLHNQTWLQMQEDRQEASLRLFDSYWRSWNSRIAKLPSTGTGTTSPSTTTKPAITRSHYDPILQEWIAGPSLSRQSGGAVYETAATMLHGSSARPEYVLSADTVSLLRGAMGGPFSQNQLVGAISGGRSITLQSGAISMPIYAAPGQNVQDIGHEVERVLTNLFRGFGK